MIIWWVLQRINSPNYPMDCLKFFNLLMVLRYNMLGLNAIGRANAICMMAFPSNGGPRFIQSISHSLFFPVPFKGHLGRGGATS